MKKQSGFTLIELMVVMAIIAILATAGLAAYTGYIKKARDTTRIADLGAINSIVLANMAGDGSPPAVGTLGAKILIANNNQSISDPLPADVDSCGGDACVYKYETCADGTGYVVYAKFESASNQTALYGENDSGDVGGAIANVYDIGSCQTGVLSGSAETL